MVLSKYNIVKKLVFLQTEQSDEDFIKFQTFHVAIVRKGCFVWKCTNMCKHSFGVQLLQNPPFCSSTHKLNVTLFYNTNQTSF
jgi:hypothetical protein